jgi:deoxyadenosine/deoxycytidine kinase
LDLFFRNSKKFEFEKTLLDSALEFLLSKFAKKTPKLKMAVNKEKLSFRKIVICGNIGVGKTTAVRRLTGWIDQSSAIYEKFEENESLPLFYQILEERGTGHYNEACFPTQMAFLHSRANREIACQDPDTCYVLDRGLLEDRYIFGQNQIDQGFMSDTEIERYTHEFEKYVSLSERPDVVVYLRADLSTLLGRIKTRGRDMEASIGAEYLGCLQKLYDEKLIPAIEERFTDVKLLKYDTDDFGEEDVFNKVIQDLKEYNEELNA